MLSVAASFRHLLLLFRSNPVSRVGAWVTTLSFTLMFSLFFLHGFGATGGAYSGMITFLALPGVFVLGLMLIPTGLLIYRRRIGERLDMVRQRPRHLLRAIGVLTVANVLVVSVVGYEGYHYMDSVEFCGQVCHTVMEPYYEAYLDSPHARVACVQCHIGPGASWFVRSKLSGARQVVAVMADTYPRPIPSPVENLRPARDTCEQCHWPQRFLGDKVVTRTRYGYDRESTPESSVLVLKTGGLRPDGRATGIHWHVHSRFRVTYRSTDRTRREIPWVRLEDLETGEVRTYAVDGVDPDRPPEGEHRTMDCVDCHNQPSHHFERSFDAINDAMKAGLVSRNLPFVKKVSREVVEEPWESAEAARAGIRARLEREYVGSGLDAEVDAAVDALASIWERNVHPDMGIRWDTYRRFDNHLGCMRCHDDDHRSADGKVISMDCENCHAVLAFQEEDPPILEALQAR